ncbi:MAG: hypothetical protein WC858_04715 [Parcubacteria group bacterium]
MKKNRNVGFSFGIFPQCKKYFSNLSKKRRSKLKLEIEIFSGVFFVFIFFLVIFLFSYWESVGGLVAGEDTSAVNVSVTVVSAISIDNPADVVLAPNLEETGTANGNVTWNVKTNNLTGWSLDVKSGTAPAMKSGANSFADYTETVSGVPESWTVGAADSEFGFNAAGSYSEAGFSENKYLGFNGSNRIQIAHRNVPSEGSGDDTTVNFRVESGASHNQATGIYEAAITATASTI